MVDEPYSAGPYVQAAASVSIKRTKVRKPMTTGRILVAGEEPMHRLLLRWTLEAEGHEVREAGSGGATLTELDLSWPDVVVLELNPLSPGLPELLGELRTRTDLPRVVVGSDWGLELDAPVVPLSDMQMLIDRVNAVVPARVDRSEPEYPDATAELASCRMQLANLRGALDTRDTIGMAKGILMIREHCSPGQAFEILSRASQRENRKLSEVAARIVRDNTPKRASDKSDANNA